MLENQLTPLIRLRRSAVFLFLLLILTSNPSAALGHDPEVCLAATPAGLNTTIRGFHSNEAEPLCFELDLGTGFLMLHLAVPGSSDAAPKLELLDRSCGSPPLRYLARSADRWLLEIRRPGSYHACATAQDPARALGEFKLTSGFAHRSIFLFEGSENLKSGEPPVDPPPEEKPKEDPEEDEPPPDPKSLAKEEAVREEICRHERPDDHGDSPFCATHVESAGSLRGEIGNGGEDDDYFVFFLAEPATVHIETTGETDTLGSLYDERGYRIAVDDDGGAGVNARIVRTLGPGLYHLRIEGRDRAEGPYRLNVDVSR